MSAEAIVAAERAVDAAYGASQGAWRRDGRLRAAGLRAAAEGLARAKDEIVREASRESALTAAELAPEFARMTRTLRMFAEVVEDPKGLWRRPTIDAPAKNDADAIGPNHDLRAMLIARRGCAVVFGASNFPLAYGAVGGDAASALAAGLGVVVKEHPAQPRTGRLLARIAREALARAGCNADVLGYAREAEGGSGREVAAALVGHPLCAAVGFTGSRAGGEAVEALARARATPIPVFAEMGSTNPVFVTRGALEERGAAIAQEIGGALLTRHGQQCTCPGMIVLGAGSGLGATVRSAGGAGGRDAAAEAFEGTLARMVARAEGRAMLSPLVRERYVEQVSKVASFQPEVTLLAKGEDGGEAAAGERAERVAPAMLFAVDEQEARSVGFLSEEAFGPAAVVTRMNLDVDARGELDGRVIELLERMEGQLAASVYATKAELADAGSGARRLMEVLTEFAGRVVVNGVTTGVRVAAAMVHGGPRPAASGGEWTAVGPRAIERWCRWVCVQNWPREALGEGVG
jgi:NADP-dependent aldehyde dehydrogenase